MKPLKARGISKETGEMVYGQAIQMDNDIFILPNPEDKGMIWTSYNANALKPKMRLTDVAVHIDNWIEIKPETLGYSTSWKDTNSKYIFSGDIVRWCNEDGDIYQGIVKRTKYSEDVIDFITDKKSISEYTNFISGFIFDQVRLIELANEDTENWFDETIVGNIYQNGDLLK